MDNESVSFKLNADEINHNYIFQIFIKEVRNFSAILDPSPHPCPQTSAFDTLPPTPLCGRPLWTAP